MAPSLDPILPRPTLAQTQAVPKPRKLGLAKEDRRAVELNSEDNAMVSRGSSNISELCAVVALPHQSAAVSNCPNKRAAPQTSPSSSSPTSDGAGTSRPVAKVRKTSGPASQRGPAPRTETTTRRIQAPRSPDVSEASLGPSSESSEEEEEVANLLLGMGACVERGQGTTTTTTLNKHRKPSAAKRSAKDAAPAMFSCTKCLGAVKICGDRKPVFVCSSCPEKAGGVYRSTKARLAEGGAVGRAIQVKEALQLLGTSSADESETPVASRPAAIAKPSVEACGRCKCGKKISALHPPCKSELMLLCEKFQNFFGSGSSAGEGEIQLNDAAARLNVQRRRLYDIINVLEAVEIIARTGKLTYVWRGKGHLPVLLDHLMEEEAAGLPAVRARKSGQAGAHPAASDQQRPSTFSLWMLSRHFVRLLLVEKRPLQLAEMAARLLGDEPRERKAQTLVTVERRLYDIGSILCSVGLIEKTYLGRRQPAFAWCTAEGVPQPSKGWPADVTKNNGLPAAKTKPQAPRAFGAAANKSSGTSKAANQPVPTPPAKRLKAEAPPSVIIPASAAPRTFTDAPVLRALPPPLTLEAPKLSEPAAAFPRDAAGLTPLHAMLPMSVAPPGMKPVAQPMCMPPGMCLSWAPHPMFAPPGLLPGSFPMMGGNHQGTMDLMRQLTALGQLAQAGPQPPVLPQLPPGSGPPMMFQLFPPHVSASMHGLPMPTMLMPPREP